MRLKTFVSFYKYLHFNKIKKRKAITSNRTKENIQRRSHHPTLAESTVITAIAPPLRAALYVNISESNHSDLWMFNSMWCVVLWCCQDQSEAFRLQNQFLNQEIL